MKLRYFPSYLKERFPPVNMGLFAILFGTVFSIVNLNKPMTGFGWEEVFGILAVISFFFRLRVFDEIKDFDIDSINHPERVLQSGKIDINTLIILSSIGFVIEVAWSMFMGIHAVIGYSIALVYSLLMRYEFFVGTWLKRSLVLYAITHMLVMPLIIAWVWLAYDNQLTSRFLILAALSVLAGFSFEISRKVHLSSVEKETIDSYSKIMGLKASIVLILILLFLGLGCQLYLLQLIVSTIWSYLLLTSLYLFIVVFYLKQFISASEEQLRKLEIGVSLFILLSYVSIILETQL